MKRIIIKIFNKIKRIITPSSLSQDEITPLSRKFGFDRGLPIDRYYINKFLKENSHFINQDVIEIGDNKYTKEIGKIVNRSVVLAGKSKGSECFNGDLTKINTLTNIGNFDCLIATQVLNFIYDLEKAVEGIYYLLKPGGVALITLAGCCQISRYDAERWGDYWRFTDQSAEKLFSSKFSDVTVSSYGNLLSATALLKGCATEEICKNKLDFIDTDYQVVLSIIAKKGKVINDKRLLHE